MIINPEERKILIDFADWMLHKPLISEYDGSKKIFHQRGKRVLRIIAKSLEIPDEIYEIRYNRGGPAVSGDLVLHSDHVYIMFNADHVCDWILYRSCLSRTDYSGGPNHSCTWKDLHDNPDLQINLMKAIYTNSKRSAGI